MNNNYKISIVTPSFNQGNYIEACIKSVYEQNYTLYEHIIIDGKSSDQTVDILKRYPHLIWESEQDRGQSHATNKGLMMATGEIIGWLNSDDFYYPNIFTNINKIFVENKEVDLVYGGATTINENGQYLIDKFPQDVTFDKMIKRGSSLLIQPSVFFRRKLLEEVGYMDEGIKLGMDYDYFLRVLKNHKVYNTNDLLSYYRINSKGGTIANRKKDIISGLIICKKNTKIIPVITYLNIFLKYVYYMMPFISEKINMIYYSYKNKLKDANG